MTWWTGRCVEYFLSKRNDRPHREQSVDAASVVLTADTDAYLLGYETYETTYNEDGEVISQTKLPEVEIRFQLPIASFIALADWQGLLRQIDKAMQLVASLFPHFIFRSRITVASEPKHRAAGPGNRGEDHDHKAVSGVPQAGQAGASGAVVTATPPHDHIAD